MHLKTNATYEEIKKYIAEKYKQKVSTLYIAQVKRKYCLEIGKNYNISKNANAKVSNCLVDKEDMIVAALKYFQMFPVKSEVI